MRPKIINKSATSKPSHPLLYLFQVLIQCLAGRTGGEQTSSKSVALLVAENDPINAD
jgi:hypothetical protein